MTHSIEANPATQTQLIRAVQSLASSAMGIEESLDKIAKRLDGIEDTLFENHPVTVRGIEEIRQSIDDLDISLTNISDALDRQA